MGSVDVLLVTDCAGDLEDEFTLVFAAKVGTDGLLVAAVGAVVYKACWEGWSPGSGSPPTGLLVELDLLVSGVS